VSETSLKRALPPLLMLAIGTVTANTAFCAWTQTTQLMPSDSAPSNAFGQAVAMQGNIAIVGAPDENTLTGAAYVYVQNGGVWTQEAKLVASDATTLASFGGSVALSGNTAIVGAYGWGGAGIYTGAVYVFVRNGSVWTQQAEMHAQDVSTGFGLSVSLDGNTALVGAWGIGANRQIAGAAYVFVRSGAAWSQQAYLTPSDSNASDQFGHKVVLEGNTALIAAPSEGHAYVFTRSGTGWSQRAILAAPSGSNDEFGYGMALQGSTAMIGAYSAGSGMYPGAVYVFSGSGATWTQEAVLTSPTTHGIHSCGLAVALSGDTALVGCGFEDTDAGEVLVFTLANETWTESEILAPSNGTTSDAFGSTGIALSASTALIGAAGLSATAGGAAYIFVRTDN
jgi:hypothetical protein